MGGPPGSEKKHEASKGGRPRENSPPLAYVINTAGRCNANGYIPGHFALEARPICNRLEACQGLRFSLSTQLSHGSIKRSEILLAPVAPANMDAQSCSCKPRQISAQVQRQRSVCRVYGLRRGAQYALLESR